MKTEKNNKRIFILIAVILLITLSWVLLSQTNKPITTGETRDINISSQQVPNQDIDLAP